MPKLLKNKLQKLSKSDLNLDKAMPVEVAIYNMDIPADSFGKIVAIKWQLETGERVWDQDWDVERAISIPINYRKEDRKLTAFDKAMIKRIKLSKSSK